MLACVHAVPRYLNFATSRGAPFRSHAASAAQPRAVAALRLHRARKRRFAHPHGPERRSSAAPAAPRGARPTSASNRSTTGPLHETRGGTPPPRSPPPSTAEGFSGHAAKLLPAAARRRASPRGARDAATWSGDIPSFSHGAVSPALATLLGAFLGTGSRARPTPTSRQAQ